MTATSIDEWAPPTPPTPAPKARRRVGLVLALVASVLALTAVSVFAFVDHGKLTDAQAHGAQVSGQLDSTKKNLSNTQSQLSDAQSSLSDQSLVCSQAVSAAKHVWSSLGAEINAQSDPDPSWQRIDDLGTALRQLNQASDVLDTTTYNSLEALFNACGKAGANSNT